MYAEDKVADVHDWNRVVIGQTNDAGYAQFKGMTVAAIAAKKGRGIRVASVQEYTSGAVS